MKAITAGIIITSLLLPISSLGAQEKENRRISAFYYDDELSGESAQTQLTRLHATAIQTGAGGKGFVWINGIQLSVGDAIGPVRILRINDHAATLELIGETASGPAVILAVNQTLTLEPAAGPGEPLEIVGIHEGTRAMLFRNLPKTRLP